MADNSSQISENQNDSISTIPVITNNVELVAEDQNDNTINKNKNCELIDVVFALESEKQAIIEESKTRIYQLRKELDEGSVENEKLKKKVFQLEQMLKQSVIESNGTPSKTKAEQEDLLIRAKTLLFEKTKVCKQQEQHIGVLKTQVDSIKEVLNVTKEMLNLRSAEADHLNSRLETANLRSKAEKEKCDILEKKLKISKDVYDKLKAEHELQSSIFKELKSAYEAKIHILTLAVENAKETT